MQEIENELTAYLKEWQDWVSQATEFDFKSLKPIHVGWKVPDEEALGGKVSELLPFVDQGHVGTVDNRKIILLSPKQPIMNVPILQIMQLRPGSSDPLGLDHVAFYYREVKELEKAIQGATYKWEKQGNPWHSWISIWFGPNQREAKFFDHTSFDLGARELSEKSAEIKDRS